MTAEKTLIDSANAAADIVRTKSFVDLAHHTLVVSGAGILRQMRPTDRVGLFSPAEVVVEGKDRGGGILVLEDRAIVAWFTGAIRPTTFERVVPLESIERVDMATRPGGVITLERQVLRIQTVDGRVWELSFPPGIFEGGGNIVFFLRGFLDGSVRRATPDAGTAPGTPELQGESGRTGSERAAAAVALLLADEGACIGT